MNAPFVFELVAQPFPPSLKLRRTRHSLGDGGQGCPRGGRQA